MKKQRSKEYRERIGKALATPKLQDALHKFGDAYLLSREKPIPDSISSRCVAKLQR